MKKILTILLAVFITIHARSQALFITKGKIEFERKTNTHRLYFSDEENSFMEEFKKLIPQFKTDYFDLVFSGNQSVYKPGKETDAPKTGFFESPAGDNVVYKDLNTRLMASQKQVFESRFLLSDSVKKPVWKLLPETRTIAGYECRKAITTICDSVVVVAFYTDEIIPSNGPESFGNLPGMILGLAVPRLYTTWFATKVEVLSDNEEKKINAPTKGKKGSEKEVLGKIDEGTKNWGKFRDRAMWFVSL